MIDKNKIIEGVKLILEGIGENLVREIRKRLTDVEGLNADNVIIHATHSHTSIDYESKRNIDLGTALNILEQFLSVEAGSYQQIYNVEQQQHILHIQYVERE